MSPELVVPIAMTNHFSFATLLYARRMTFHDATHIKSQKIIENLDDDDQNKSPDRATTMISLRLVGKFNFIQLFFAAFTSRRTENKRKAAAGR